MPLTPEQVPSHIETTFCRPIALLEKGTTVPELYDWHARENPNFPLFVYNNGDEREFVTYASANQAMDRAARYIISGVPPLDHSARSSGKPTVIAILARADTITYFCTTIGVIRAGYTAFLISIRNGAAGVADMLKRTGAIQLIVSQDDAVRNIARDALARLPESQIALRDMPVPEDLFPTKPVAADSPFEKAVEFPAPHSVDTPAVILHSSGSTSFPKTIPWTHKVLTFIGHEPLIGRTDTQQYVMGCQATPMFHAMGAFLFTSAPICGSVVATFKPAMPPVLPTPETVWQAIVASKADFAFTVPALIEEWARDLAKVEVLRSIGGVIFGGAPLNREVGDALASQGVNLYTAYGMTEVGNVNLFNRPNPGLDWEYFQTTPSLSFEFRPHDDDTFELIVLSDPKHPLPVVNTEINGQPAYATNDLVQRHPTKPHLWRVYGRADEQIMLSNGEKTNPLPIESIINKDPHVHCSVMFGRGKFQNGILVEPAEDFQVDSSDVKAVEAFRNLIWPTVERANRDAPQHSRIFKEMILVASPEKPFQLNVKGTPRRSVILGDYHDEIEALYKQVEDSSQSDLHAPSVWDEHSTLTFVRAVVEQTLRRTIGDDDDIFRNGGDSLQATWIRNTISRAIRETDPKAATRLPANLVFQAPTISSLAHTIHDILHDSGTTGHAAHTPQDLWKYVEKYSANLPPRPAPLVDRPESGSGKDVVLITGTTGGFGCDALEHLLRDERVARVYAFNRKGSSALERQRAQFRARGLDEALLDSPKFRMVEAVLHEPGFGVEPGLLDEVRRSVTHILHNAWKVNFNLSLASFEVDIQGARNFVDLAISSPYKQAPTILFVSSIGVFTNYQGPSPAPEASLDDPTTAFGTGYAESKWVTEHVLQNAAKERGVHTIVMRLGQVTGNKVGYWNEKEWFPSLVKSARFQRCLPDIAGSVAWIPGYEAAKAFAELRRSPAPYVHLVHPRPVPWHTVVAPLAEGLGVPLVSFDEWLSALKKSVTEGGADEVELLKANPALRLLSFFSAVQPSAEDREPLGLVYLSTEKATAVSEALRDLPQLDAERARGWLAAWKRAGFL
ncbi:acetyl-CoA synthetase-like protein [Trametes polyzona]|nr:acetyl-CoA synthetase-like protein [Trametes polyzona]